MRQQICGEVVDFNLAFFQFIWECNSENIIKIGPYLPKLLQEKFGAGFRINLLISVLQISRELRKTEVDGHYVPSKHVKPLKHKTTTDDDDDDDEALHWEQSLT